MTSFALVLVLAAAVAHALWNLLAKRAGEGGPVFVWLFAVWGGVIWLPVAIGAVLVTTPRIGVPELVFLGGSMILHLGYFLLLQRGYRASDLSLIYPLARGTGPLLATMGAVVILGERPGLLALAGGIFIGLGVVALGVPSSRREFDSAGVIFGLLTGLLIAGYTVWDKHAVGALAIPPVLLVWTNDFGRVVLLAPLAVRRWPEVRRVWRAHRLEVIGVAVLSPLAYILVLVALTFTPVSYVAPAREASILIATILGVRLLGEAEFARRFAAGGVVVAGLVALALG